MTAEISTALDASALELPAPFVNKFHILVSGSNVRLAFAEGFAGQPSNFRSAVVMSASDARDLAQAILETLPPRATGLINTPTGLLSRTPKTILSGD